MNLSIDARLSVLAVLTAFLFGFGSFLADERAHAQALGGRQGAEEALRAGIAAQKARRHDVAVRAFSRAINAGSLARKQLTYALYRRAISNRAQRQPAQAISDLNGALFFNGDLSAGDRANAIEERIKAFRDAGLKPTAIATADQALPLQPVAPTQPASTSRSRIISSAPPRVFEPVRVTKPRTSASTLSPSTPILKPSTAVASQKSVTPRSIPTFQTRVEAAPKSPPRAEARIGTTTVPRTGTWPRSSAALATPKVERGVGVLRETRRTPKPQIPATPWQVATKAQPTVATRPGPVSAWTSDTVVTSPVVRAVTPQTIARPAEAERAITSTSGGGVGQFFSNLFGGAGTKNPAASAIATAAVGQPAVAVAKPQTAPPKLAKASLPPTVVDKRLPVTAAVPTSPTPVARAAKSNGKLEIEVALLRNKHRADALARQLMVQYPGGGFWSAKKSARVVESGTDQEANVRYSVRYGAFESRADIDATCEKFKANGLGCAVVPQG